MAGTRERYILPLPTDVIAQLKSSTAIVSLTYVVLELLKNSLDAGATKVDATVDFTRGNCSVEDDGRGIAPLEFGEEGGLGKLYCTSKYYSEESYLGRNGTFLASLAATSLLTITSHHHEHRSQNAITFHHSKAIDRQLPTSLQLELGHGKQGTRVTVRNLFGNLPVRVKQRAVVVENRAEHDRLWDTLKRETTGIILGWRSSVSLQIRDAGHGTTAIHINGQKPSVPTTVVTKSGNNPRSRELHFILNVLTQANCIKIDEWPAWVPASASTSTISIKGAISLDPAATRRVQFISFGIRHLSSDVEHNELYDEINRVFALSSFGTVEDDADIDEVEKLRRKNDRRFKSDGYTNRQLKGRKGVDRFPMFYLRISLKDSHRSKGSEARLLENEASLQAVTEVLNAMVTQWLSVHHYRPRKHPTKQSRPDTALSFPSTSEAESQQTAYTSGTEPFGLGSSSSYSPNSEKRKRKRPISSRSKTTCDQAQQPLFSTWSRIKSGKAIIFDKVSNARKPSAPEVTGYSSKRLRPLANVSFFDTEPVSLQALDQPNITKDTHAHSHAHQTTSHENDECTDENARDTTIVCMHPTTKQTYLLNARTGCVMPETSTRSHTGSSISTTTANRNQVSKSVRIRPRSTGTEEREKNSWVQGLLQTWNNPVFKPVEKRIQQVSLEDEQIGHDKYLSHFGCSRVDAEKAFSESSMSHPNKLSKTGLQNAEVIAQLDKKFILVKISSHSDLTELPSETLVIIDQHAADERVQVEDLFAGLCAPVSSEHNHSHYRSKLGHKSQVHFTILEKCVHFDISVQEQEMFTTHAARFGAWGILYDTCMMADSRDSSEARPVLSVTTLPPSISERCKAYPQLLISFLRSTVWKYAEDPHLPSLLEEDSSPPRESTHEQCPPWLKGMATCPQGLVDFVNSRACRSAIMFNDELSIQQCEELVSKLSKCAFPFMCAHGRPSMVPLLDLGHKKGTGGLGLGSSLEGTDPGAKLGFVSAWKQWKKQ
ncbi:DNA mismatch repair protein [Pleomassaria siparia CBS 279.74]|uniref:DNA mismatch repair protein n=1 Tax=Pleomassaria siparia CBS 279.74 TaxID=1314801 RepID=A0A6G1K3W7_9PLEO|nr:DNA mismatch repair protein [Pleomassaria siparia CBS 279.74]